MMSYVLFLTMTSYFTINYDVVCKCLVDSLWMLLPPFGNAIQLLLLFALQSYHEREYEEKRTFIDNHPLFRGWSKRLKLQLEVSLSKQVLQYGQDIIKQGQDCKGLIFVQRSVLFCFKRRGGFQCQGKVIF